MMCLDLNSEMGDTHTPPPPPTHTQVGMQQHEQLGGLFRTRYVTDTYPNFLNSNYTRVQVSKPSTLIILCTFILHSCTFILHL